MIQITLTGPRFVLRRCAPHSFADTVVVRCLTKTKTGLLARLTLSGCVDLPMPVGVAVRALVLGKSEPAVAISEYRIE
jgi:hypothetical protein